jgi:hypothetical protein
MGRVRLDNAFKDLGIDGTISKVETIMTEKGGEHYISCYHPRVKCTYRKREEMKKNSFIKKDVILSKYCPFAECRIRKY